MQYPHTLEIAIEPSLETTGDGYQTTTGQQDWQQITTCRDEPNSSSRQVNRQDGVMVSFSSLIQTPKSVNVIPVGSKVRVKQGEWIRLEGEVKRFDKGAFHCRIWV